MNISEIRNTEELLDVIKEVNDRFSYIARTINDLEASSDNVDSIGYTNDPVFLSTKSSIGARSIRFGYSKEATVKNNTLFTDIADNLLKIKGPDGIARVVLTS